MVRSSYTLSSAIVSDEGADAGLTSSERAYRTLKRAIIDGALTPSSTVSEQQLAVRLKMSRTPVHQALSRLQADGWVTVAARSGVRISAIDADDLQDSYETLMALEGVAAARLADRPLPRDDVDQRLEDACLSCEEALAAGDLKMWGEMDNILHNLLLDECGNSRLGRAAQTVAEQAHRARILTVELRPWPSRSNEDHRAIVNAILERRPDDARRALENHRHRGMETLVPIVRAMAPTTPRFVG